MMSPAPARTHGVLTPVYRMAARAPVLSRVRRGRFGSRLVASHWHAQAVEETFRYTVRDVLRAGVHRYRPRGMSVSVYLRHGSSDGHIVREFAISRLYDPPDAVREQVGEAPRVLDLGGHVGLFGAHALTLWPDAHVVSYEPDRANADLLERAAAESGRDWRVVRAAAWTEATSLAFRQDFAESRVDPGGDVTVEAVDVLPVLRECDLAKIDIEGAEWRLFADPRFRAYAPGAMIVECHPAGRGGEATDLLAAWGYCTTTVDGGPPGAAMVWAWGPH